MRVVGRFVLYRLCNSKNDFKKNVKAQFLTIVRLQQIKSTVTHETTLGFWVSARV